jgi:hypothetical protein
LSKKKRQTRRVHIDGQQWTYRASWNWVVIRDPEGKSALVRSTDVDADSFPTPQMVKNYIWKKLRPGKMIERPQDTEHAKEMIINLLTGAIKERT